MPHSTYQNMTISREEVSERCVIMGPTSGKTIKLPNGSTGGGGTKVVDAPATLPSGSIVRSEAEVAASTRRPAADKGHVQQERRRNKRVNMKLSARVRPFDLTKGDWNEVLVTLNASRQSIYFTTSSDNYHVGMRLRVTFPFTSVHDSAAALEDNGEVMRTERLPGNLLGVAVQMWGPAIQGRTAPKSRPSSADGTVAERRIATRRPFSAEATVFDSDAAVPCRRAART
jgi:hypothetical protein